jgi:hypothetical protein
MMFRTHSHRQIAFFAAFTLALQTLFANDLQAAFAVESGTASYIALCTGEGFKQIALDAQGRPIPQSHEQENCADCVLTCGAPVALPPNTPQTDQPTLPLVLPISLHDVQSAETPTQIPHSRAPPPSQNCSRQM